MDAEIYLKPISDSDPVGEYWRWEPEYDELENARRSDEDMSQDTVWRRESKRADWARVIELGTQILLEKSKDLQVVAYMSEAWTQVRGLAGIRDGLELMWAVQDAFWEKAHPESGDLEMRRGIYEFLDDPRLLPARIRSVALTRVEGAPQLSYSFLKYREALETEKNYSKATNEKERSLLEGNLRSAEFDEAAASTPRSFYVELIESLQLCRAAAKRLNDHIRQKWPASPRERPPQLSGILTAIDEVEREAKRLLARKPALEVLEPLPSEDEPPPGLDDESRSDPAPESVAEPPIRPARASRSPQPTQPLASLNSTDDAVARIVDAAHYLRQADQADPAPYLILRAVQAAGLYRGDDLLASGELPAPATEARQKLHQMSKTADGGQWGDLLEDSEQALGRPEGRGWLDLHFYSTRALETLGHSNAARACKSILATWLQDNEKWPESYLKDGTPCASGTTKDWIQREWNMTAQPADLDDKVSTTNLTEVFSSVAGASGTAVSFDANTGQPDPWDEAQALCRAGRLNEAMSVMVQAVRQARAGRERFFRTLQQAELCLSSDRPGLALPLLEMLAQRIDDLRLDQWEDGSLCARVLSHLYRCLKGKDEARATAVYNRLCQIDAGEALLLSEIGLSGTTGVNLKNGMNFKKRSNPSLGKTDIMSS